MTLTNAEKMIANAAAADSTENLGALLKQIGNPEKKLGIIKVMGESGKSSVCALLSAVLSAAGYRVGRLVTPVIHSTPTSICVCERPISIDLFTDSASTVHKAVAELKKNSDGELAFSGNDLLFATAFTAFCDAECDFAVIEIPTDNISHTTFSKPLISVITTIHEASVARDICARLDRDGGEVITAIQSREVYNVIFNKCAEINCRLTMPLKNAFHFMASTVKRMDFTYRGIAHTVACGAIYQTDNLLTVFEATDALKRCGLKILGTDICSAVLGEGIPLRFEPISVMPAIIVDRADTKSRRAALISSLKKAEGFISKNPLVICEQKKRVIREDFIAVGFELNDVEIPIQSARKDLRPILKSLNESDTVIVLGSSKYCESIAKIIKEILM